MGILVVAVLLVSLVHMGLEIYQTLKGRGK